MCQAQTLPTLRASSIHFLGKEGWAQRLVKSGASELALSPEPIAVPLIVSTPTAPTAASAAQPNTSGAHDLWSLPGDSAGVAGRFRSLPITKVCVNCQ